MLHSTPSLVVVVVGRGDVVSGSPALRPVRAHRAVFIGAHRRRARHVQEERLLSGQTALEAALHHLFRALRVQDVVACIARTDLINFVEQCRRVRAIMVSRMATHHESATRVSPTRSRSKQTPKVGTAPMAWFAMVVLFCTDAHYPAPHPEHPDPSKGVFVFESVGMSLAQDWVSCTY